MQSSNPARKTLYHRCVNVFSMRKRRRTRYSILSKLLVFLVVFFLHRDRQLSIFSGNSFSAYSRKALQSSVKRGYEYRVSQSGWDEAYVNYFNGAAYVSLTEVVIDAVHAFSTKPILVYVSGTSSVVPKSWLNKYPRLVVFEMPETSMHPWFDKLRVILMAPVRKGVILESDTIISPSANNLFPILEKMRTENVLQVLAPDHPDTRPRTFSECQASCYECCINPYDYPMHMRSGQYRHAHLMWTEGGKPFIRSILKTCIEGPKPLERYYDCTSDEAAVNLAMWNSNVSPESLCLQDPDTSYWEELYFSYNQSRAAVDIQKQIGPRTVAFNFCHGLKDAKLARRMLQKLKKLFQDKNVPWILHNGKLSSEVPHFPHSLSGNRCILS